MSYVQISDKRKLIYINRGSPSFPGFNDSSLNITDNTLRDSFDIVGFKIKLNKFFKILSVNFKFEVDEIFKYYTFAAGSLSNTLLLIIIYALHFSSVKKHNLMVNAKKVTRQEIYQYRIRLWNNNFNKTLPIIGYNTIPNSNVNAETGGVDDFHKVLYDTGLFEFYNYFKTIENVNAEDKYLNKIKILSQDVNKYFFLTELLLKLLSDTRGNIDSDSTDKTILRNFSDYTTPEEGIISPNNWGVGGRIQYSCKNGRNPYIIENNMKYKLLRNIYDIVLKINRDRVKINNKSIELNKNTENINNDEVLINKLRNDQQGYNNKITTLLKKQEEITSSNKITFIKTLLLFIISMAIIISNIYISTTNEKNKLLQFNICIIVIIFIMKFYYLFK